MTEWRETVLDDVAEFARWHVASGDIDPVYPVLARLVEPMGLTESVRFVLLYVAFYDLSSALTVWQADGWSATTGVLDERFRKLPTGTERRAHRAPHKLVDHLAAVHEQIENNGVEGWLLRGLDERSHGRAWQQLQGRLRAVHGNGRWAAYKTGEILSTVLGWPVEPTDAGHDFSSGPRHGLALIYPQTGKLTRNDPTTVTTLDGWTLHLQCQLAERGVMLPVEQVETVLCDFHALVDGRYYVGHDIDQMLHQVMRDTVPESVRSLVLNARFWSFDEQWLGELHDWQGVRSTLKHLYADTGTIRWWP